MNSDKALDGYLYAVLTRPCWFEPHVAIETGSGIRMLKASDAGVEISSDGPFEITEEAIRLALSEGLSFSNDEVQGLWSARFSNDFLEEIFDADKDRDVDGLLADGSFDWSARTQHPSLNLSNWLRRSEDWAGSSSAIFSDSDGAFSGSFITLFTANPYKLAVLLTWLGVPREIIASVTGLDDVLPS